VAAGLYKDGLVSTIPATILEIIFPLKKYFFNFSKITHMSVDKLLTTIVPENPIEEINARCAPI
jgi:hypothetical protein